MINDADFLDLKREGILLTKYYAQTHPSQPNYIAAVGGDYFGLNHDDKVRIPENVSTIVDLLDTKGISWGGYFEDQPGPGFLGFASQGSTGNGGWDYVRKHKCVFFFYLNSPSSTGPHRPANKAVLTASCRRSWRQCADKHVWNGLVRSYPMTV